MNKSKAKPSRKKILTHRYRTKSNNSLSELLHIAGYKAKINNLVHNNRRLARELQRTRRDMAASSGLVDKCAQAFQQILFARVKIKDMARTFSKLVNDMDELTQYLDGIDHGVTFASNGPLISAKKIPAVDTIEEVSGVSDQSAEQSQISLPVLSPQNVPCPSISKKKRRSRAASLPLKSPRPSSSKREIVTKKGSVTSKKSIVNEKSSRKSTSRSSVQNCGGGDLNAAESDAEGMDIPKAVDIMPAMIIEDSKEPEGNTEKSSTGKNSAHKKLSLTPELAEKTEKLRTDKTSLCKELSLTPELDMDFSCFRLKKSSGRRQTQFRISTSGQCKLKEKHSAEKVKNKETEISADDKIDKPNDVLLHSENIVIAENTMASKNVLCIPSCNVPNPVIPENTLLLNEDMELTENITASIYTNVAEIKSTAETKSSLTEKCIIEKESSKELHCVDSNNILPNENRNKENIVKGNDKIIAVTNVMSGLSSSNSFKMETPKVTRRKRVKYATFFSDSSDSECTPRKSKASKFSNSDKKRRTAIYKPKEKIDAPKISIDCLSLKSTSAGSKVSLDCLSLKGSSIASKVSDCLSQKSTSDASKVSVDCLSRKSISAESKIPIDCLSRKSVSAGNKNVALETSIFDFNSSQTGKSNLKNKKSKLSRNKNSASKKDGLLKPLLPNCNVRKLKGFDYKFSKVETTSSVGKFENLGKQLEAIEFSSDDCTSSCSSLRNDPNFPHGNNDLGEVFLSMEEKSGKETVQDNFKGVLRDSEKLVSEPSTPKSSALSKGTPRSESKRVSFAATDSVCNFKKMSLCKTIAKNKKLQQASKSVSECEDSSKSDIEYEDDVNNLSFLEAPFQIKDKEDSAFKFDGETEMYSFSVPQHVECPLLKEQNEAKTVEEATEIYSFSAPPQVIHNKPSASTINIDIVISDKPDPIKKKSKKAAKYASKSPVKSLSQFKSITSHNAKSRKSKIKLYSDHKENINQNSVEVAKAHNVDIPQTSEQLTVVKTLKSMPEAEIDDLSVIKKSVKKPRRGTAKKSCLQLVESSPILKDRINLENISPLNHKMSTAEKISKGKDDIRELPKRRSRATNYKEPKLNKKMRRE